MDKSSGTGLSGFDDSSEIRENFGKVPVDELSISTRIFTRKATEQDSYWQLLNMPENMVINQLLYVKNQM